MLQVIIGIVIAFMFVCCTDGWKRVIAILIFLGSIAVFFLFGILPCILFIFISIALLFSYDEDTDKTN